MIIYAWDDRYLTGHAMIDQQHRELFAILNRLYTAMKEHRSEEGIRVALEELHRYVQWHFEAEEEVMRELGYPQFDEHCTAHREFTRQVEALRARGDSMHPFELLNFIANWIVKHVGNADVEIGRHLRSIAAPVGKEEQVL